MHVRLHLPLRIRLLTRAGGGRNTDVGEKHRSVAFLTYPDQGLNPQPRYAPEQESSRLSHSAVPQQMLISIILLE